MIYFLYREADLETSQQRCRAEEGPGDEGEGKGTKGQYRWDYFREKIPLFPLPAELGIDPHLVSDH
jgi:hypothetical protein